MWMILLHWMPFSAYSPSCNDKIQFIIVGSKSCRGRFINSCPYSGFILPGNFSFGWRRAALLRIPLLLWSIQTGVPSFADGSLEKGNADKQDSIHGGKASLSSMISSMWLDEKWYWSELYSILLDKCRSTIACMSEKCCALINLLTTWELQNDVSTHGA